MGEYVTHADIADPVLVMGPTVNCIAAAAIKTGALVYISDDKTVTAYVAGNMNPLGVALNDASAAGKIVAVALPPSIVKMFKSGTTPATAGTEVMASTNINIPGSIVAARTWDDTTAATVIGTVFDDLSSSAIVYVALNFNKSLG